MQFHPMSARPNSGSGEQNALLQALPKDQYEKLIAETRIVPLRLRHDIVNADEPIRDVWFPQSGLLSVINEMRHENVEIEVGVIGREGFAGLPLLHGANTTPCRIMVQLPGEARRIPTETFLQLLEDSGEFSAIVHRFAVAYMNQATQQAACNRLHSLEQRCAKWLLTTHDHMAADELPLTQEFLAVMLGVRRPGVTVAAQTLEGAGMIKYQRGRIKVTDRTGLEQMACECYRRIRADYEKLLGRFMIPGRASAR